jgi:hypothetical protein
MQHLKYTYVDSVTGVSITDAPAANGPVPPAIAGLDFDFALESQYPTNVPIFFGTAPDEADVIVNGVIDAVDHAAYESARANELEARKSIKHRLRKNAQSSAENAGFAHDGNAFDSDQASREKMQQGVTGAMLAQSQGLTDAQFAAMISGGWRNTDGAVAVTTIQGMIDLGLALGAHMGACDQVSQSHKTLIDAAANFDELSAIDVTANY